MTLFFSGSGPHGLNVWIDVAMVTKECLPEQRRYATLVLLNDGSANSVVVTQTHEKIYFKVISMYA